MKIYLDLIFLLNLFFDLILLVGVKIILKRNVKFKRLILGSLLGSSSIFFLFLKINSLELFCFKLFISILMLLVSFGYHNIRYFFKNFVSLYIISAALGGFLYLINNFFAYKSEGLVFFHKGLSINIIFLVLITPVIIYIYIKENHIIKNTYGHYYPVKIIFSNDYELNIMGYLDTGNNLVDPISKKEVIFINKALIKGHIKIRSPIYVPFKTVSNHGLVECLKPKAIYLNHKLFKNILVALSEEGFNLDNIDCLLNNKLKERLE